MNELMIIGAVLGYFALGTVFYGLLRRFGIYVPNHHFFTSVGMWLFWPILLIVAVLGGAYIWLWEISSGGKK